MREADLMLGNKDPLMVSSAGCEFGARITESPTSGGPVLT